MPDQDPNMITQLEQAENQARAEMVVGAPVLALGGIALTASLVHEGVERFQNALTAAAHMGMDAPLNLDQATMPRLVLSSLAIAAGAGLIAHGRHQLRRLRRAGHQ